LIAAVSVAACSQSQGGRTSSSVAGPRSTGASPASAAVSSAAPTTATATRTSTATTSAPTTPTPSPTRRTASAAVIPPISARARRAGLLDVRTVVPDAIIDLHYATTNNFTHVQLYPKRARCLIHRSMARGLKIAAARLRHQGDVLVFWDCYRPHSVQVRMYHVVPDPNWVAKPGPYADSHEAARSVDVTVARAVPSTDCPAARRVQGHCLLAMGTGFDDFTARAHAFATAGVSSRAQADRALLRTAMNAGGLQVYTGEWWHFDGPGSFVQRPYLDAPVY
jgi:D-alanyl-D-alanine dipeptidase